MLLKSSIVIGGGSEVTSSFEVTAAAFGVGSSTYDNVLLAAKTGYQVQIKDSSVYLFDGIDFDYTATGIELLPGGQLPVMVANITLLFHMNFTS